jgi:hypothetical protein
MERASKEMQYNNYSVKTEGEQQTNGRYTDTDTCVKTHPAPTYISPLHIPTSIPMTTPIPVLALTLITIYTEVKGPAGKGTPSSTRTRLHTYSEETYMVLLREPPQVTFNAFQTII